MQGSRIAIAGRCADLPALRERLIGKGYTSEVVDDVIERLATRVQLIDDEAYAQSAGALPCDPSYGIGGRR